MDSRGGYVVLSTAGAAAIAAAAPRHVANVRHHAIDRLSAEQLDVLIALGVTVLGGQCDQPVPPADAAQHEQVNKNVKAEALRPARPGRRVRR